MLGSGSRGSAALAAVWLAVATGPARAAVIVSVDLDVGTPEVQPTRTIPLGGTILVDVWVSGIDDWGIREFEVALEYDASVLALIDVFRGSFLSGTGDDFGFFATPLPGGVHALELRRTLGPGASGEGDLFSAWFETVGVGDGVLSVDVVHLRPPLWPFVPDVLVGETGNATVTVVPEPATGMLVGLGCAVLALRRRATSRA